MVCCGARRKLQQAVSLEITAQQDAERKARAAAEELAVKEAAAMEAAAPEPAVEELPTAPRRRRKA